MEMRWRYNQGSRKNIFEECVLDIIDGLILFTVQKEELSLSFTSSTNPDYKEEIVYSRDTGKIHTVLENGKDIKEGVVLPVLSENVKEMISSLGLSPKYKGLVNLVAQSLRE